MPQLVALPLDVNTVQNRHNRPSKLNLQGADLKNEADLKFKVLNFCSLQRNELGLKRNFKPQIKSFSMKI